MNVPVRPTRPPWARESRFGYVDLRDMVDHRPPWSRQARPPEVARARPGLRVIELVEISARGSVELVDERTRSPDTPAVGPRITNRVRRSMRPAQPPRTRGLDRLDHPDPWSRQARPAEVARARPVRGPTGPTGDRACRDHCARVRRARR